MTMVGQTSGHAQMLPVEAAGLQPHSIPLFKATFRWGRGCGVFWQGWSVQAFDFEEFWPPGEGDGEDDLSHVCEVRGSLSLWRDPLPPTYSSDRVGGKAIKFPLMRGRSWGWEAKGPCESQKTSSKERLVLYVHHPDARLGQRHQ